MENKLIVENAQEAIISVEKGGMISSWNFAAEKAFGWSRNTATVSNWLCLLRPATPISVSRYGIFSEREQSNVVWLVRWLIPGSRAGST